MQAISLNHNLIQMAQSPSAWDLGNSVLYELCAIWPKHVQDDEIIAKIWLIGRTYAAAIERRRNKGETEQEGGDFYLDVVVPKIRGSGIDDWLNSLSHEASPTLTNCQTILEVHKNLTDLFRVISGLEKRSLASKYLHFHYPNLFFIYDTRAAAAIMKFSRGKFQSDISFKAFDAYYADFYLRCLNLIQEIDFEFHVTLTPRQVDNLLLYLE